MHNIDGVVIGNNRTSPESHNLETMWHLDHKLRSKMTIDTPFENRLLGEVITRFSEGVYPVEVALNLHSTNGAPNFYPHFVPHFSENVRRYGIKGVSLFRKQKKLADYWRRINGRGYGGLFNPGNSAFLKKDYPETWFWHQYKDDVLAITFEATYGLVPGKNRYFTANDHHEQGRNLARSVLSYFRSSVLSN